MAMYDFAYFANDAAQWDTTLEAVWGSHDICPIIHHLSLAWITKAGLTAITELGG